MGHAEHSGSRSTVHNARGAAADELANTFHAVAVCRGEGTAGESEGDAPERVYIDWEAVTTAVVLLRRIVLRGAARGHGAAIGDLAQPEAGVAE
eukprot:gene6499-biopygen13507